MGAEDTSEIFLTHETVEDFALGLRELRLTAGEPTLIALSTKTGISKSVISEAFLGRKLPTERTVGKLAEVLGGDRDAWVKRRRALDPKLSTPSRPLTEEDATRVEKWRFSLAQMLAVAGGAALIAVLATSVVLGSWRATTDEFGDETITNYHAAENGADPMLTECREDAVIAASEPRLGNQVQVQMMYSNACQGVWGRVTRYDGKSAGNSLSMRVFPADEIDSPRAQERSDSDLQSLYTPMLVEPDVEARVCGVAVVSVDGELVELGPPICI